jgi:hypothetical protein
MEKQILRYSYWLGIASAMVAMLWRLANQFGIFMVTYVPGTSFGYMTVYKGAVLLLLVSAATALYVQQQEKRA